MLVISVLFNIFAFPFSSEAPLKVYFKQSIDLDAGVNKVSMTGMQPYLSKYIVPELPSTAGENVACKKGSRFPELYECSWEGKAPEVAPGSPQSWIKVKTTLARPGYGKILIGGHESRYCNIYFDTPVTNIGVTNSSGKFMEQYRMPSEGLTSFSLWSRTFDRHFEVEFGWEGEKGLTGRVSCGWDDKTSGKIPALEEVIAFLPTWATVSKHSSGLVEVTQSFKI